MWEVTVTFTMVEEDESKAREMLYLLLPIDDRIWGWELVGSVESDRG